MPDISTRPDFARYLSSRVTEERPLPSMGFAIPRPSRGSIVAIARSNLDRQRDRSPESRRGYFLCELNGSQAGHVYGIESPGHAAYNDVTGFDATPKVNQLHGFGPLP